jgi:hypothetical protein
MNLLCIHKIVIQENEILKLQNKLQKETDEKKQNDLKMEIIKLNGKIKKEEIGRIG